MAYRELPLFLSSSGVGVSSTDAGRFEVAFDPAVRTPKGTEIAVHSLTVAQTWQNIRSGVNDRIWLSNDKMSTHSELTLSAGLYTVSAIQSAIERKLDLLGWYDAGPVYPFTLAVDGALQRCTCRVKSASNYEIDFDAGGNNRGIAATLGFVATTSFESGFHVGSAAPDLTLGISSFQLQCSAVAYGAVYTGRTFGQALVSWQFSGTPGTSEQLVFQNRVFVPADGQDWIDRITLWVSDQDNTPISLGDPAANATSCQLILRIPR